MHNTVLGPNHIVVTFYYARESRSRIMDASIIAFYTQFDLFPIQSVYI